MLFRWFKFTLKPPYTVAIGNFFLGNLGHFPLTFLCQIWSQDSLRHVLGPHEVHFDICQFLATPGPFEYFGQKQGSSESQCLLHEGATGHQSVLGVLGGQVPRLYGGTIFGGGATPWGHLAGLRVRKFRFRKSLSNFFDPPNFGILTHKLAQVCNHM